MADGINIDRPDTHDGWLRRRRRGLRPRRHSTAGRQRRLAERAGQALNHKCGGRRCSRILGSDAHSSDLRKKYSKRPGPNVHVSGTSHFDSKPGSGRLRRKGGETSLCHALDAKPCDGSFAAKGRSPFQIANNHDHCLGSRIFAGWASVLLCRLTIGRVNPFCPEGFAQQRSWDLMKRSTRRILTTHTCAPQNHPGGGRTSVVSV